MHDAAFADAARPATVVCLRLPLLQYSLGHEILLWQQRNPILTLSAQEFGALSIIEQNHALIRAVIVCSNDWGRNKKRQRWLKIWGWMLSGVNWGSELDIFRKYLIQSRAAFPGPHSEADFACAKAGGYTPASAARGRISGAPLAARLLTFLLPIDIARWDVKCVYDFPFGLANMLYETALEADGAARIENVDEYDEKVAHLKWLADKEKESQSKPADTGLATMPPDLAKGDECQV